MSKFRITNKNNHSADVYIRRDGYSRRLPAFGYISLGELTSDEIATYKKYSIVGLVLEVESEVVKPVVGVKQPKQKVYEKVPVKEEKKEVIQEVKKEPVKEEKQEVVQEVKKEPVKEEKKEVEHVKSAKDLTSEEIDKLTSAELKAAAAELGVSLEGISKKSELREALKKFLFG